MCIDLFCWNVRGFNVYSHRNGFKKWFQGQKPLFGGIIETHVKQLKMQKFVNGLLPSWYFDDNYGFSELGKIWVIWHPSVKVVILNKSLQAITCEVQLPSMQQPVIISIVYASNDRDERMELWNELASTATSPTVMSKPWLVLGDFNQTLDPSEHSKPVTLNVNLRTRQFRDCLLDSELADLTFRGSTFTW